MTGPAGRELVVMRHGQAHNNLCGVIAAASCTGLTEAGRRAAAAAGARLRRGPSPAAVHASPIRRARQTAEIVAAALDVPVRVEPELRAPDPGAAEGLRWADVRARPQGLAGEPWSAYARRATGCVRRLLAGGEPLVLVVGHTETVAAVFTLLVGDTGLGDLAVNVDYTALTTFRSLTARQHRQRWELVSYNDTDHVPAGLPRYPGHRR